MEKPTRFFLSTMFVHDSDAAALKPVRLILENLNDKKFGEVSYYGATHEFFATFKEKGKVLIICSGRLHLGPDWLTAGEFAKLVKDTNPEAIVIAYSTSDEPQLSPGSLDAYIKRDTGSEMQTELMFEATTIPALKGQIRGEYFRDAVIANFINEVGATSDSNEFIQLIQKFEGICFLNSQASL